MYRKKILIFSLVLLSVQTHFVLALSNICPGEPRTLNWSSLNVSNSCQAAWDNPSCSFAVEKNTSNSTPIQTSATCHVSLTCDGVTSNDSLNVNPNQARCCGNWDLAGQPNWNGSSCTAPSGPPAQPNLYISYMSVPTSGTAGQYVGFSGIVRNNGNASTGGDFPNLWQYYNGSSWVDIGAVSMGGALNGGDAGAWSSSGYTFNTPGNYQVRMCADKDWSQASGIIAESNEGDNCSGGYPITINAAAQASCSVNWTVAWGGGSCAAYSSQTVPSGGSMTLNNTNSGYSGSVTYGCSNGNWSWQNESCTQNVIPQDGSCGGSLYTCSVGNVYNQNSDTSGNYSWQCTGVNGGSSSGYCTAYVPPSPPTASLNQSIGTTAPNQSFTVSWSSSNATSCSITKTYPGGGTFPNWPGSPYAGTTNNSFSDGDPSPGTYSYAMTCTGPSGSTSAGPIYHTIACPSGTTWNGSSCTSVPPPPTNPVASCSADGTTGTFSWTAPSGWNTFYTRASVDGANLGAPAWDDNYVGTSKTFTTTPGKTYTWWVHTKNTSTGEWSTDTGGQFTCPAEALPTASITPTSAVIKLGQSIAFTITGNDSTPNLDSIGYDWMQPGQSLWSWQNGYQGGSASPANSTSFSPRGSATFNSTFTPNTAGTYAYYGVAHDAANNYGTTPTYTFTVLAPPQSFSASCNASGVITISGVPYSTISGETYPIRVDDQSTPWAPGSCTNKTTPDANGDYCYDDATTLPQTVQGVNGHSYGIWAHTYYGGVASDPTSTYITCSPPNLTAGSTVGTDDQYTAVVGISKPMKAAIFNDGTGDAGASSALFQVATGPNGTGSISNVGNFPTSAIGAKSAVLVYPAYTFPSAGTWSVRTCADTTNVVNESSEGDNCGTWSNFTVVANAPTVSISPTSSTIKLGQSVTYTVTGNDAGNDMDALSFDWMKPGQSQWSWQNGYIGGTASPANNTSFSPRGSASFNSAFTPDTAGTYQYYGTAHDTTGTYTSTPVYALTVVAAPQSFSASCNSSGVITLSGTPYSTISGETYPIRVNDTATPWTPNCSSSSMDVNGDYCIDSGTTLPQSVQGQSGHSYDTWAHTCYGGVCSDAVFSSVMCQPATCNLPWGGTLANNDSVVAYDSSSVVTPDLCTNHKTTRTCTNGVLSGGPSYIYESCGDYVPPDTSISTFNVTPKTVEKGGMVKISWNITSPNNQCRITAEIKRPATCSASCESDRASAETALNDLLTNGNTNPNDPFGANRNMINALTTAVSGTSARGEKSVQLDYSTTFTASCGGTVTPLKSIIYISNSNEG